MNNPIRLVLCGFFLTFLFLPIAQCSYTPCKTYGPELEAEEAQCIKADEAITEEITIYKESPNDNSLFFVFVASVVFPLVIGMLKSKWKITLKVVEFLGALWLSTLVYSIVYWAYKPLIFGHLFFVVTVSYTFYLAYSLYIKLKNP